MKKLLIILFVILAAGCANTKMLEQTAGPPGAPPTPVGTAAEIAAGTGTSARIWAPKTLADEFAGATAEVQDDAYGVGWNGDTTHAPSQNAAYDIINTLQVQPAEGALQDGDKTKLDAIEAAADVTDATNVAAAGALMDSGTDNIDDTHINWGSGAGQVDMSDFPVSGSWSPTGTLDISGATVTFGLVDGDIPDAHSHAADAIDAITEIAAALKSGSDTTLMTGTAGTSGNCVEFNADGDLVDSGGACGGGNTALDDIGNPDANNSISMAGYTDTRVSTTDGWGGLIFHSNVANNASPTTLLTLQYDDANDSTNNSYLKIIEDADGTPATLFEFKGRGLYLGTNATIENIATITASSSVSPQSADGATLGTTALEWSDLYLADAGVIYGGADQDTTFTHVADTGWIINSTRQLQFGDSGTHIAQLNDGHLDLTADTSIDLNGAVVTSSTANLSAGAVTLGTISGTIDGGGATSLEIPNSTSDMTIGTEGQVGLESTDDQLVFHGGSAGEIQGEAAKSLLEHITITFDPAYWYDQNSTYRVVALPYIGDDFPEGFTMTEWKVYYTQGDPTTELDADIICDTTPDFNPAAGATVMDVIDTTAGASTADSGFDSGTCANGSQMYIRFGADPTDANVSVSIDIWGYAEAD